jgi:predicted Co/Zn/Cd cation transporter (cation efflux family)
MCVYEYRVNRRIGSDFIRLDVQSWLMTAAITAVLLVAFGAAWTLTGTRFDPLTPYVDPAVLIVLTITLVFVPIGVVRKALREVLLMTPPELDAHVRQVMDGVIARHGFKGYTSYAARQGRVQFVVINVEVAGETQFKNADAVDAIRREIADAVGGDRRWMAIQFTADRPWL